jgi:molecular chaperone GrpE
MIQRTLLRQSRALGPCTRSSPRTSLVRPQFRPSNISFAPTSRAFTSSKWLGAELQAKKEDGEAAAEEGKKGEDEDPMKKELEVKNREIIDLKVRNLHPAFESLELIYL